MKNKNLYFIALIVVLFGCGFGCQNTTHENFTSTDCMAPLDGWETKTSSRFNFSKDKNSSTLDCFYYEPESEKFDLNHKLGHSWGNWQNHYEIEIKTFTDTDDQNEYYDTSLTEMLNAYCKNGSEVVMPLLFKNSAINERYQCSWPAEWNGNSYDYNNTNALISITKYKDAVITTAIIKETGKSNFTPSSYADNQDENTAIRIKAENEVYNSSEFQIIPDAHEQELIDYAISLIDK